MGSNVIGKSEFTQTVAVHSALAFALEKQWFKKSPAFQRAAEALIRELEAEQSSYGRQLRMLQLLQDGASLADLCRQLKASRRTIFRYLNALEEARVQIRLEGTRYFVSEGLNHLPLHKKLARKTRKRSSRSAS